MNSQKEIRNIKIKNQLELWLFCAIIGAVAGGLVWALLKIMAVGMNLIWEWVPEHFLLPYYSGLCDRCIFCRCLPEDVRRLSGGNGNCYGKSENGKAL